MEKIEESVSHIGNRIQKTGIRPRIGLVLGSGLGHFVDCLEERGVIPYGEIPSFCRPRVDGHVGYLRWGKVSGVDVVVLQGRVHLYEGCTPEEVVLPVRVCGKLGIECLFLTNAAGGIHPDFLPGDLVRISDHLNLTGCSPLEGALTLSLGPRFPDMTEAYNVIMGKAMVEGAREMGYPLKCGVYAGVRGPNYETPAEVNMLRALGADMVGMSTVLECLAAHHMGIKVGAVSCITNKAAGIGKGALEHGEVIEQGRQVEDTFVKFLQQSIVKVNRSCLQ